MASQQGSRKGHEKRPRTTFRAAGIEIHSIGVYTNLIHPDEAERKANLAYFDGMMKVGKAMGSTCPKQGQVSINMHHRHPGIRVRDGMHP